MQKNLGCFEKRGKKGQFYLIAAAIIVFVVIGFVVVKNYAKTDTRDTKVYDLGEELKIETGYVYDYGVYNQENTNTLIDSWTDKYLSEYSTGKKVEDWVFVYGNTAGITAVTFSATTIGTIGLSTSSGETNVEIRDYVTRTDNIDPGNDGQFTIEYQGYDYDFDLKPGENFYFIIRDEGYIAEG